MINVKRTTGTTVKAKDIVVTGDGKFADSETGEYINLADILFNAFNGLPFSATFVQKADEDVTPTEE